MGTAAHCVEEASTADTQASAVGENVSIARIADAGVVAYSSVSTMRTNGDGGSGNDFALIEVRPEHWDVVNPAVQGFGGPTGVAPDHPEQGDHVLFFGNSSTREEVDPLERLDTAEGYVVENFYWEINAYTLGPGIPGDSGSPMLSEDGSALGVVTGLDALGRTVATPLWRVLNYMEQNTDLDVELATWAWWGDSRLPGPLPPSGSEPPSYDSPP